MAKAPIVMNFDGGGRREQAMIDQSVQKVMDGFSDVAKRLDPDKQEYKTAMNYAGELLRDAMRAAAPESGEIHYRYQKGKGMPRGTGKLVATYMPGNLRRSIKVFSHMNDKTNVYVGVEIQPRGKGGGVFTGDRTDGWYARFLEYNPGNKPFLRPAVLANRDRILRQLQAYVERQLNKA